MTETPNTEPPSAPDPAGLPHPKSAPEPAQREPGHQVPPGPAPLGPLPNATSDQPPAGPHHPGGTAPIMV
jgi:hypothetical protein